MFHRLYNHLNISDNKEFIDDCLKRFNFDNTMYDYCLVDVKMQAASHDAHIKDKLKRVEDINAELTRLKKIKKLSQ